MNSTLNQDTINSPPQDAATVILIRDARPGIEVLLLRRGSSQTVMNNAWVFPGGKLDKADFEHSAATTALLQGQPQLLLAEPELSAEHAGALYYAACRETQEETGVHLTAGQLYPWSRWITPTVPSMMKKRFDARFFIARMPADQTARHDGQETTASTWYTARDALQAYMANDITLVPPQIMTLAALSRHQDTESVIDYARAHAPYCIEPKVTIDNKNARTMIYPGDPDHPDQHKQMPGPTRLIWLSDHFEPVTGFEAFFTDH